MTDGIRVRFEPDELPMRANLAAREAQGRVMVGLAEIGLEGQTIARSLAPEWTGAYKRSIAGRVMQGPLRVEIKSSSRRAHLVQGGRGPGRMPPVKRLKTALRLTGPNAMHDAFVIARAIGRSGTDGVDVLELARHALEPRVRQVARDIAEDIGRLGDRRAR